MGSYVVPDVLRDLWDFLNLVVLDGLFHNHPSVVGFLGLVRIVSYRKLFPKVRIAESLLRTYLWVWQNPNPFPKNSISMHPAFGYNTSV